MGDNVGEVVGEVVGKGVGEVVGEVVGKVVGDIVGKCVGERVGEVVGEVVGEDVQSGRPISKKSLFHSRAILKTLSHSKPEYLNIRKISTSGCKSQDEIS